MQDHIITESIILFGNLAIEVAIDTLPLQGEVA